MLCTTLMPHINNNNNMKLRRSLLLIKFGQTLSQHLCLCFSCFVVMSASHISCTPSPSAPMCSINTSAFLHIVTFCSSKHESIIALISWARERLNATAPMFSVHQSVCPTFWLHKITIFIKSNIFQWLQAKLAWFM